MKALPGKKHGILLQEPVHTPTTRSCHEALEKWPVDLFSRLLPRIYQIVEEINRRFVNEIQQRYPGDQDKIAKMAVVYNGQVRMAYMAIVAGFSVNGVARLHTEILKHEELKTSMR